MVRKLTSALLNAIIQFQHPLLVLPSTRTCCLLTTIDFTNERSAQNKWILLISAGLGMAKIDRVRGLVIGAWPCWTV